MSSQSPQKKKIPYLVSVEFNQYLLEAGRLQKIPVQYQDLLRFTNSINLYDKQSTSVLLNLFIREISILGFNSEISQIATKSEFFDVFKNTMTEILIKVCAPRNNILQLHMFF